MRRVPENPVNQQVLGAVWREIANTRHDLDDEQGSEQAFRIAIDWLKPLALAEGDHRTAALVTLRQTLNDLLRCMRNWDRGDSDRLPILIELNESKLAGWNAGDQTQLPHLINGLLGLGQTEQRLGKNESAQKRFEIIAEIVDGLTEEARAALPPNVKGSLAISYESRGSLAFGAENWEEAERLYRRSLETWLAPNTTWQNVAGHLMACRVKVRLAALYKKSGKEDDPQRIHWLQEAQNNLNSLEESGDLPQVLNWVLKAAQNELAGLNPD